MCAVVEEGGLARLVRDSRADRLATDHDGEPPALHQPLDGAMANVKPLTPHLSLDLARAIDLEVLGEDPHGRVTLRPYQTLGRIKPPGDMSLAG